MPAPVFTIINFDKADNPYTITGEGYVQKLGQLSANFSSLAGYMAEVELTVEGAAADLGQAVTDALNANPTESAMEAFLSLFLSTTFTAGTDYLAPDGDGGQLTNLNPSAIAAATTTTPGVTQLKTSYVSPSETEAATPKSVKQAYDALNSAKQDALWTVSQEEAEVGTSTTARKWTPQRVRQAVKASAGNNSFIPSTAIAQGKACILNADGTVSQSAITPVGYGTPVTLGASTYTANTVCYDPVAGKFLQFYIDSGDSNKGKCVVGTIEGTTITYGGEFTFSTDNLSTGSSNNLSAAYDEDTGQIIVSFVVSSVLKLVACTISGDSVTFGLVLNTGFSSALAGICYDTSVNKIVCNSHDGTTVKAYVFSVSGTSLSFVSTATMVGSGSNGYCSSIVHMKGYMTAGWNVAAYNTGGNCKVKIVKIDPSTFAITFGGAYSPVHTSYDTSGYCSGDKALAWSELYQRLLVLSAGGPSTSYLMVNLLQVTATDYWATAANSVTVSASGYSGAYQNFHSLALAPNGATLCVVYSDPGLSYYGKAAFSVALSASSIAIPAGTLLQSNNIGWCSVEYLGDSTKAYIGLGITTSVMKTVVGTAPVADNRAKFIGFAQNTVSIGVPVDIKTMGAVDGNQSGLTPGTLYYLSSSDGTTVTSTVNGLIVGKALSATEVLVGTYSI